VVQGGEGDGSGAGGGGVANAAGSRTPELREKTEPGDAASNSRAAAALLETELSQAELSPTAPRREPGGNASRDDAAKGGGSPVLFSTVSGEGLKGPMRGCAKGP